MTNCRLSEAQLSMSTYLSVSLLSLLCVNMNKLYNSTPAELKSLSLFMHMLCV